MSRAPLAARPRMARSGPGAAIPWPRSGGAAGAGAGAWGGGGGGRSAGPLSPPLFPAPRPHPFYTYIYFFPSQVLLPRYPPPPWIRRRLAIGCWDGVRQSDCDVQSSCFLQLCLKVNLVVERSPERSERSEIIHHCSGEAPRRNRAPPGPPARSRPPPRAPRRAAPARVSLLSSSPPFRLRSLSPLLLSPPRPPLSLSPLSHSPRSLARCRTDSPSLVQLLYSSPASYHRA